MAINVCILPMEKYGSGYKHCEKEILHKSSLLRHSNYHYSLNLKLKNMDYKQISQFS